MPNIRDGRGNDTLFSQTVTDAFNNAVFGYSSSGNAGQVVQSKVLLAQWEADAPGAIEVDTSLGFSVVTAWRDILNGIVLTPPSLAQAPRWITSSDMTSTRPVLSFDGIDDWIGTTALSTFLNNLQGVSMSLALKVTAPALNTIGRVAWIESGTVGVPRLGYARSNIGGNEFYTDGVTFDTDPVSPITGAAYPDSDWAAHIVRRDFLNGNADVEYNGTEIISATGIPTENFGDSSPSLKFQLGAQDDGQNPGQFTVYGVKIYTYYMSSDEVTSDTSYYGGKFVA